MGYGNCGLQLDFGYEVNQGTIFFGWRDTIDVTVQEGESTAELGRAISGLRPKANNTNH
jgi:hypothetical protein